MSGVELDWHCWSLLPLTLFLSISAGTRLIPHPEALTAPGGTSNVTCGQRGRQAAGLSPVEACVGVMGMEKGLALGTLPRPMRHSQEARVWNRSSSSGKVNQAVMGLIPLQKPCPGGWWGSGTAVPAPRSVWGLNLFPFPCDTAAKYGNFKSPEESQNLFFLVFHNGKHGLCECSRICARGDLETETSC